MKERHTSHKPPQLWVNYFKTMTTLLGMLLVIGAGVLESTMLLWLSLVPLSLGSSLALFRLMNLLRLAHMKAAAMSARELAIAVGTLDNSSSESSLEYSRQLYRDIRLLDTAILHGRLAAVFTSWRILLWMGVAIGQPPIAVIFMVAQLTGMIGEVLLERSFFAGVNAVIDRRKKLASSSMIQA